MIRTENLSRKFGSERGIFDVNLEVPEGAIYGFVGHNGAGKTTTIKILCGLLKPESGKAWIGDIEVTPSNIPKIKRKIGYMPDITGVYEQMSVWEFMDFYGAAFKIPPAERKKRITEALELANASYMTDYQMTSLSRGMRQKVALAKTIIHNPEVLILDEPAGGLDPNARIEMRQTIANLRTLGKTILLSSHILPELASICDRVGIISKGKLLAQGTVKEISGMINENIKLVVTVDSDAKTAASLLATTEGIGKTEVLDANQITAEYSGSRESLSAVLRNLIMNGVAVRYFDEAEEDLENVYMNIVKDGKK